MMDLDADSLFRYFKVAKNSAMIAVELIDYDVIDEHLPIVILQTASLLCLASMKQRGKSKEQTLSLLESFIDLAEQ